MHSKYQDFNDPKSGGYKPLSRFEPFDISPYLPINTVERVEAILELISRRYPGMADIEEKVFIEIRKFKLQLYFKEKLQALRTQSPTIMVSSKNVPKKVVSSFRALPSSWDYSGYTVAEIANDLDMPVKQLINFFLTKGHHLSEATVLKPKPALLVQGYAKQIRILKARISKLDEHADRMQRVGEGILREKFKASQGPEGNYAKLIYTRPKS